MVLPISWSTGKKHSGNKSVNAAERKADWWLFGGFTVLYG